MNSNRILSHKFLMAVLFFAAHHLGAAIAEFDILVVDADNGDPIKGVDVVGWFANRNGWKAWTESAPTFEDRQVTDQYGICHVKGETNTGKTGVNIHHPPKGYYPNSFSIRHAFSPKPLQPMMHWQPTDLVITAALQRVGHPIPLFVKCAGWKIGSDAIAKNGNTFAYDLVKGSLLPPFGHGEVADIVFTCPPQEFLGEGFNGRDFRAPRYKNIVKVTFQGDESNGILVSQLPERQAFLRIRTAPENGYERAVTFSEAMSYDLQHREGLDNNRCFCFRIRTMRDKDGKVESSLYGKIYGDPKLLLDGTDRWTKKIGGVVFIYYLNPTPNDRNLEWDMKHNLCPRPGNLERIVNHNPMLLP